MSRHILSLSHTILNKNDSELRYDSTVYAEDHGHP
jgi:hypothetical protein